MNNKSLLIRLILFAIITGMFLWIYSSMFSSRKNKDISIILRYDDFASASSLLVEKEILNAIDNYSISCSFGVIPFTTDSSGDKVLTPLPLSTNKIDLIYKYVQTGSIEICQHGYMHATITSSEPNTEFKGLPINDQNHIISTGKRTLDSVFNIHVTTFIPPWNSYDQNTLQSLADQDFSIISADNRGVTDKQLSFNYIPFTATISELKNYLNFESLPFVNNKAVAVILLHDYDFYEINNENGIISIADFRNTIEKITKNKWKIVSIDEAIKNSDSFGYHQYKLNGFKLILLSHLSYLVHTGRILSKLNSLKLFYVSDYHLVRLLIMVILYYLVIILLITQFVFFILNKINAGLSLFKILSIIGIMVFLILIYLSWTDDHLFGKNELHLLIINLGLVLGLAWFYYPLKHRNSGNGLLK